VNPPAKDIFSVLRRREEFLAVARQGKKWAATRLILQCAPGASGIRYGLTASRAVGKAVIRNRAKRRLRVVAREILPDHGAAGYDYVLIARSAAAICSFADLRRDLITALRKLGVWREKSV
jgi:ribonuclease P protein component